MNQHLQKIQDFIEQAINLSAEEKAAISKAIKATDSELTITEFKLERTEKVKRTTGILLEETIEELEQKRKAVEDKNHELEIEAALEKVRSAALAMRVPADMLDVCRIICKQLTILQINGIRNVQTAIFNDAKQTYINYEYYRLYDRTFITEIDYGRHPVQNAFAKKMLAGPGLLFTHSFEGAELNKWIAYQKESGQFADPHLDEIGALNYYWFSLGLIAWGITFYMPVSDAEIEIIKRFRNVFDLAYRRFADIQLAEAQAREAQIQLALERVRARTMAMHHSAELADTASVLFEQIKDLGFETWSCGFCIWKENDLSEVWMAADSGGLLPPMLIPYKEEPTHRNIYEASLQGKAQHEKIWEGDDLAVHYGFLRNIPSVSDAIAILEDSGLALPSKQCYYIGFFNQGYLLLITKEPNCGAGELSRRFALVFEQTYTRFLDLQKAEEQAREAFVESALERMRSRTMAMHNSRDVAETVASMFEELIRLGIGKDVRLGVGIIHEDMNMEVWTAYADANDKIGLVIGTLNLTSHQMLAGVFNNWTSGLQHSSYTLTGDDQVAYYKVLNDSPDYEFEFDIESLPEKHFQNVFYFREGIVYTFSHEQLSAGSIQICKRFAGVFGLTYRRFLDLQKAEAQAREAQIETALERVRSSTLAMQKSNELAETAAVLFRQMIGLGIEPNRLYIGIIGDRETQVEFWITDEDGTKVSSMFTGDANKNVSMGKMQAGWKAREKSVVIDMQGEELAEYFHYLGDEMHVPFKGGLSQKRRVQYISYFSNGFIGMASPDEQPQETIDLLDRFAYVFNLTYARFNDLKIAERHAIQAEQDLMEIKAAKQSAEKALIELRATQRQLIQAEKMASLGELTAGIAHEIQNPLNFVNNFSEVNKELLEELKAESEKPNAERDEALEMELINDLIENEQKINHHGKRADGIVKGMLQHSRSSAGEKQLTNINVIADEFFKLSYHGLRAKDKTFNAEMITYFDPDLPLIEAIGQDIGRVLLNLFNNAFYAVNQKMKALGAGYNPEVSVSTSTSNGQVIIKVKDNGTGMSPQVKEKIMQPFFTTKPTGEGTGLGLSLTYDMVVKGHGGSIQVNSVEGEFTEFVVLLPLN